MADGLAKAKLIELDGATLQPRGKEVSVQFNPESLKVTFTNAIKTPDSSVKLDGAQDIQFVGSGATKLTAMLWFDVTQELTADQNDVRKLTQEVAFFMTPVEKKTPMIIPYVSFQWGTFRFDGVMEAMDETLELFSSRGEPLRASVNITLGQQRITAFAFGKEAAPPPSFQRKHPRSAAGTVMGVPAPEGASLQSMAADQPGGGDWQSIAAANGIENPRRLVAGQRINFGG